VVKEEDRTKATEMEGVFWRKWGFVVLDFTNGGR